MRILVTGGNGFVGRALAQRLAGEHEVLAMVRRTPPDALPGVTYVEQDLSGPLDRARLPDRLDAVINQAVIIYTGEYADPAMPFLVNVVAPWRLLQYAQTAGARTFIHASTGGIYGTRDQPFREDDPANPMDLYSLTKAQAELAVQAAPGDFTKIILRYAFPYGADRANQIRELVGRAVAGEPIEVLASGKPRLNPMHISDAVEATVRCLSLEADEVLNIAGAEITTFTEIARLAAQRAGREPALNVIPDEAAIPYYRSDIVADISRMQARLGFTPGIRLQDGIAELADHRLGRSQ